MIDEFNEDNPEPTEDNTLGLNTILNTEGLDQDIQTFLDELEREQREEYQRNLL